MIRQLNEPFVKLVIWVNINEIFSTDMYGSIWHRMQRHCQQRQRARSDRIVGCHEPCANQVVGTGLRVNQARAHGAIGIAPRPGEREGCPPPCRPA